MTDEEDEIIDEEHITKALWQLRSALIGVMKPLRRYGQEDYVVGAIGEILKLAWQLHWKLVGIDMPYEVDDLHW